jgi:predicted TIM-barrel fold metal-dependent hydrolase
MPLPPQGDAFALHAGAAVDSHFHLFAANHAVAGARYTPSYAAEWADWAAQAGACGVGRGLLVQPSFLGTDNRHMLQALAQAGRALRGVAVVAPDTPAADLQGMHALGVRGIRLNLAGVQHDVQAWCAAAPLWSCLDALGWHLELHTDTGALPGVLAQLLPRIPTSLRLVLDHFGKPARLHPQDETLRAVQRLVRSGHTAYVKLSGSYRLAGMPASRLAQHWLAELGPARLLWGSDWPCTNHEALAVYAHLRADLDAWLQDAAVAQAVLVDNPHGLLL